MTNVDKQPGRKLFSRGELITLVGMVMVVASVPLHWAVLQPAHLAALPAEALFRVKELTVIANAYQIGVGWLLVTCSAAAGILLLWTPTNETKRFVFAMHVALGAGCILIALMHISLMPGVLVCMVGGGLLVWGGAERSK